MTLGNSQQTLNPNTHVHALSMQTFPPLEVPILHAKCGVCGILQSNNIFYFVFLEILGVRTPHIWARGINDGGKCVTFITQILSLLLREIFYAFVHTVERPP